MNKSYLVLALGLIEQDMDDFLTYHNYKNQILNTTCKYMVKYAVATTQFLCEVAVYAWWRYSKYHWNVAELISFMIENQAPTSQGCLKMKYNYVYNTDLWGGIKTSPVSKSWLYLGLKFNSQSRVIHHWVNHKTLFWLKHSLIPSHMHQYTSTR